MYQVYVELMLHGQWERGALLMIAILWTQLGIHEHMDAKEDGVLFSYKEE